MRETEEVRASGSSLNTAIRWYHQLKHQHRVTSVVQVQTGHPQDNILIFWFPSPDQRTKRRCNSGSRR